MSRKEDHYLLCMRVADLPVPTVPARKLSCSRCHAAVWASEGSVAGSARRRAKPLCKQCAQAMDVLRTHLAVLLPQTVREVIDFLEGGGRS